MLDLEAGLGNLHRDLGAPSNVVGEARLQFVSFGNNSYAVSSIKWIQRSR
jgi:hypothetical protein